MRLTPPGKTFFLISLILFLLGALGTYGVIDFQFETYALLGAWIVLALGCLLRGV